MEQLLIDLVERGILAVSAEKKLAQKGYVHLTIYPSKSEVEEAVKDYLGSVEVVSVNGQLASLRHDHTYYGLDLLGEIPLFVDEDIEFHHPESGKSQQGYEIEQGLSHFHSTFEPMKKDMLESRVFPSNFTGGVQL